MKYQAVLVKEKDVELKVTNILNLALFLNVSTADREIESNCLQTIEQVYSSGVDLKGFPL